MGVTLPVEGRGGKEMQTREGKEADMCGSLG